MMRRLLTRLRARARVSSGSSRAPTPPRRRSTTSSSTAVTAEARGQGRRRKIAAAPRRGARSRRRSSRTRSSSPTLDGAPDPASNADAYRKFLTKKGISGAYLVTVEITEASEELVPMERQAEHAARGRPRRASTCSARPSPADDGLHRRRPGDREARGRHEAARSRSRLRLGRRGRDSRSPTRSRRASRSSRSRKAVAQSTNCAIYFDEVADAIPADVQSDVWSYDSQMNSALPLMLSIGTEPQYARVVRVGAVVAHHEHVALGHDVVQLRLAHAAPSSLFLVSTILPERLRRAARSARPPVLGQLAAVSASVARRSAGSRARRRR